MSERGRFVWGERTYVMGILNATPDSFSGDGLEVGEESTARAVAQVEKWLEWGVDLVDVGGESTRPNSEPISAETEEARILPIITTLRHTFPHLPISVDTYRAQTAKRALEAGADWVNDVWGLRADPLMVTTVAQADCPVVIMHNGRNRVRKGGDDYYGDFAYDDVVAEVYAELADSVALARHGGVRPENILLDVGIGFGKNREQNLTLLRHYDHFRALGYPLLLGTSRKGFIGQVLGNLPPQERLEGTAATIVWGIGHGADMIRVHDVREMVRVARMADALARPLRSSEC